MLSLKEFRGKLRSMREKIVAISPIIGNRVISGPAEKYMKCMNVEVSPLGVAKHYRTILGKFIISESDGQIVEKISKFNICVHRTNIIMKSRKEENSLANYILTYCLQH
jgi:LPPG:FO 2-phospho-L-lactate transferase